MAQFNEAKENQPSSRWECSDLKSAINLKININIYLSYRLYLDISDKVSVPGRGTGLGTLNSPEIIFPHSRLFKYSGTPLTRTSLSRRILQVEFS